MKERSENAKITPTEIAAEPKAEIILGGGRGGEGRGGKGRGGEGREGKGREGKGREGRGEREVSLMKRGEKQNIL